MFESDAVEEATRWVGELARLEPAATDAERVDRIRAMEEAKNALSAAQARETAALAASLREDRAARGVRRDRHGLGIAAQVGLARRESPHKGAVLLGLATILCTEMPHTLHAMTVGVLSEWRATVLVRETACLTLEDRRAVDRLVAGDLPALERLGNRELVATIGRLAQQLDAEAVTRRARKAHTERCVTVRPAPDTMTWVTALLPVQQGVAVYAALRREADRLRSAGDLRSRGQVMADTLVERITGRPADRPVPVHVSLVMTDRSLLGGSQEPADLPGYGIIPAELARQLVCDATGATEGRAAWLRRLYTAPHSGRLLALDSRADAFPSGLRRWIEVRDRACRTPWCDAPVRHADHVRPRVEGGDTSADNGQGLCEACNYAKEAPGWRSRPRPGPRHTVETTTPTGHSYRSTAPPLPGTPRRARSGLEVSFADIVLAA